MGAIAAGAALALIRIMAAMGACQWIAGTCCRVLASTRSTAESATPSLLQHCKLVPEVDHPSLLGPAQPNDGDGTLQKYICHAAGQIGSMLWQGNPVKGDYRSLRRHRG